MWTSIYHNSTISGETGTEFTRAVFEVKSSVAILINCDSLLLNATPIKGLVSQHWDALTEF